MRIGTAFTAALVLCSTLACSPRDFLSRRLARDLIAGAEAFKSAQIFSLKSGVVSNQEFNSPESLVLQRRGWIIGTEKKCPPGVQPAPCWDVVLSPAGVDVFKPLVQSDATGIIPIRVARREVVDITGISKAGTFADVEFTWHWVPTNEVGKTLYDTGMRYRATVGFRCYDDGWRVLTEQMRSNQSLEDALQNSHPVP
jgi:hypothetical protein